jgi:hypothetical protein
MTWFQAKRFCKARGMDLAIFESTEEMNLVFDALPVQSLAFCLSKNKSLLIKKKLF